MRNYSQIITAFYGSPWCILPAKLAEIEAVLWRRIAAGPVPVAAASDEKPIRMDAGYTLIGSAAVVPISGVITPRPSLFSDYSGGTSAEGVGKAVDAAANDPKADAIVLDVDSPGGYYSGTPEAAAKIAGARKAKPVYAVANHMAASGAYWLASQAGTFALSPSSQVGSIGVMNAHIDETKLEELQGVRTSIVTSGVSPFKTENYPQTQFSAEARAHMQAEVDKLGAEFVNAVAKGRNRRPATVERDFGQGRMKFAPEAVEAGMADRIASLEQIIAEINGARTARTKRRVAADMAAAGLPTA